MSIYFSNNNKPHLFCHRGIHLEAPENTLPAFEKCLENNFKAIETDIHICKSGELVILHDFNLNRIAGIDKKIEDLTLDEIKKVNVKSNEKYSGTKIPTLEEVFKLCSNNVLYDLELKSNLYLNKNLTKKTWDLICKYKLQHNCLVSSFNPFAIKSFQKISNYSLQSGIIYSEDKSVPKVLQHGFGAKICHCNILKPEYIQVNSKKAKDAQNKGYKLLPWTVDSVEEAKKLINYKVFGIVTNNPFELRNTGFFN